MRGMASVIAGLQREQAPRLVTLASLKQDERADNSRNGDQMVVVGEMAKFSENLIASLETSKQWKGFGFQELPDLNGERLRR